MKRRFAKIDANQTEIVEALRAIGCSVVSLAPLGNGCPDLLVGIFGKNLLMEVKDGDRPPSQRKLTSLEREFRETWKGQAATVYDAVGAIAVINYYTGRLDDD